MHINYSSGYYYYAEPDTKVSQVTNVKVTEGINFNNSSDYYHYPEIATEMSQTANIKPTQRMLVKNSSKLETEMSQTTNIETIEQTRFNKSSDYYYFPEIETKMSPITNLKITEPMYVESYPNYKKGMKSNLFLDKNTIEPEIQQTIVDARRHRHRKNTYIYIYDTTSTRTRNRHEFYAKNRNVFYANRYGRFCKYLGYKRCKTTCYAFFRNICSEVTKCTPESYDKYMSLCEARCSISFHKPNDKDFFKRITTALPTLIPRAKLKEYAEDRWWKRQILRFRAEEEENNKEDHKKVENQIVKWHKRKLRFRVEKDNDEI
ncbi:uncharacterized protein LOC113233598 isoform X2 [Hyposmocoma kahamanoa]|uniref:uncharacterized protein LOC113233598 isoform X2 n=1 Tax=Hyposmocoma kahamanoa TaxID=1477025 RepID=UPI000E6D6416|nr:uncharacterized protein LOC113233598 isoform X2 [Hyposmocoma kahamanoa]